MYFDDDDYFEDDIMDGDETVEPEDDADEDMKPEESADAVSVEDENIEAEPIEDTDEDKRNKEKLPGSKLS